MDEQMIRAAREIDAVPILPRDCDGGLVDLAAEAAGFHPDERIGIVEDEQDNAESERKAREDHDRYMRESRCKKPAINVNVYITCDEVIDVCHHNISDLNPFCVRIGAQYDTTQTLLHMSRAQAENLYRALGAALQDYQMTR